ncbi:MAG: VanZ family protein [Pseudolysinimonas sp.]
MPRRVVLLIVAGVAVLAGALLVGLLPDRVDGGVAGPIRAFIDRLQASGAPVWVNYDLVDFVANIAFFVPIGLVAALLLPWRVWWLAIPIGAALSTALELGQALFLPQRYASATDVLANTLGAVVGALIAAAIRSVRMRRAPSRQPVRRSAPR